MAQTLEADVALLHIAGGGARITPPPGTLAQTAPRRSARGRANDLLFINLSLLAATQSPPGLLDHLANLAAEAFYGTPGSVTSALREAAAAVNSHLVDTNKDEEETTHFQGRMMTGVLREDDLYLAQCGIGQAILVRPGQVTRLTSEEAANRPLGIALTPFVRYYHIEIRPGDLLILTTSPPPLYSDTTLSGLSALDTTQAMDRLVAASSHDLTGVIARFVPQGEAVAAVETAVKPRPTATGRRQIGQVAAERRPRSIRRDTKPAPSRTKQSLGRLGKLLRGWLASVVQAFQNMLIRMAPGLVETPRPGTFSPNLMAVTAVAVPLIIVVIAAVAYFGIGRRKQFQEYLLQAAAAMQVAQMKPNAEEARVDWDAALHFLNLADTYGSNSEADQMRQQAQEAIDTLDKVIRLDFRSVISGGFGPEALLTAIAASATDLYVLDAAHQVIWRTWGVPERGYEIDSSFECLNGPGSFSELGTLVDIVIQPEPGALGEEGIVSLDQDGTLLYCAPDSQPALAQLTPPDIGWGRIQAIDVFDDGLYVLDPVSNSVWIYNATGGLFSGNPEFFFVEEVRDLKGAIDLAMTQDELLILYADGRLDRCRREREPTSGAGVRIRVECDPEPKFEDERPGYEATANIPGAVPMQMAYSPPPEPSLFFLDSLSDSIFHYSMRLVYQGQYVPLQPFEEKISAFTLGPPNDMFLAVGSQVFHARPRR